MANMTYIDLPNLSVRKGRNSYPLVSGWDGFQGGLVGLLNGVLVKWQDVAGILFLGLLHDWEGSGTGVDDSAVPGSPEGRVNENGDELLDVPVTGVTAQTDVGGFVYCTTDNWNGDLTLSATTNAKAIGWLTAFKGAGRGNVRLFTPHEYVGI